jgi:hypothetical protein
MANGIANSIQMLTIINGVNSLHEVLVDRKINRLDLFGKKMHVTAAQKSSDHAFALAEALMCLPARSEEGHLAFWQ